MCGTDDVTQEWLKTYPQEEGDFLWVSQWSCGCYRNSGLCVVFGCRDEIDSEFGGSDALWYRNSAGKLLCLQWCGTRGDTVGEWHKPYKQRDGRYDIQGFLKLNTRSFEEDDGFIVQMPEIECE